MIDKALLQVSLHNTSNRSFLVTASLYIPRVPFASSFLAENITFKTNHENLELAFWTRADNQVSWLHVIIPDVFRSVQMSYFHGFFTYQLSLIFGSV